MYYFAMLPVFFSTIPAYMNGIIVYTALFLFSGLFISVRKPFTNLSRQGSEKKQNYQTLLYSALMMSVFVIRFYFTWRPSNKVKMIAGFVGLNVNIFLLILSALLFFAGTCGLTIMLYNGFLQNRCPGLNRKLIPVKKLFSGKRFPLLFSVVSVLLVWLFQSTLPLWGNTDNYWIANTLNGIYADENYCIFISPFLAKLVRVIDLILPSADGLTLLGEVLALLGIGCVMYMVGRSFSKKLSAGMLVFIIGLTNHFNLLHLPFTSFTGELAFYGFFCLFSVLYRKAPWQYGIFGTAFLCFSMLWRFNAFLIFIPFALLLIAAEYLMQDKKNRMRYLRRVGALFLVPIIFCAVCIGVKTKVDNSEKYAPGISYNKARSDLVDYPTSQWASCQAELESMGISENDYLAANSLILADTTRIDTAYMENILSVSTLSNTERTQRLLIDGAGLTDLFTYDPLLLPQFVLALLIAVVCAMTSRCIISSLEMFCSVFGAIVICGYFIYCGRIVGYVIQTVLFGIALVFSVIALSGHMTVVNNKKLSSLTIILTVVLFSTSFKFTSVTLPKMSLLAKNSSITEVADIDDDPSTLYVWDVNIFDRAIFDSPLFKNGKLLSEEFIQHNLADGEWQYGQPYYIEYLSRIGVDNPMEALVFRDHAYYVAKENRKDIILTYLQEHFDAGTTAKQVGEVYNTPIWQFLYDGAD